VEGTGFYLTRYGLVATARHVVDDFVRKRDADGRVVVPSYVLHRHGEAKIILREIRHFSLSNRFDIAVVHAENYRSEYPKEPLTNKRGRLSTALPPIGARLVTYGYPQNEVLDFRSDDAQPSIRADFYEGELLEYVERGPGIPYTHFRTSIQMPHGTSGGPVFFNGHIVGVNCRAWDFGADDTGPPLSSVIPIAHGFEVEVGVNTIPETSWEWNRVAPDRRSSSLTLGELALCGVIDVAD
jgi:hypothetical protein